MTTMKTKAYKTTEAEKKWYVVDAGGKVLGRMAAQIASVLRGKHRPTYTPNQDVGDHVIVINAEKVVLTGNKLVQKKYYRHTGYPGGLRETTAGALLREKPTRVVSFAITGMLPKTKLGKAMGQKLRVYAGPAHPHAAQQPEVLETKG